MSAAADIGGRPLAIDLYCGLGGWTSGLQAAGWDVIGWDIEQHAYDGERYPGQLVVGDVRALHGSQIKSARLIVGSSPCTEYSYMAMPWIRAKAKAAAIRADESGEALRRLNELFDAQFRIQREACAAAGRHVPLVVENVKGAQPWVGRSRAAFGSYHLWGDVPALMPSPSRGAGTKVGGMGWYPPGDPRHQIGAAFNPAAQGRAFTEAREGRKLAGFRFDGSGRSFQSESVSRHVPEGRKNDGGSWFKIGSPGQRETNNNPDGRQWKRDPVASCGSRSPKRKAASAKIAKIPFTLAHWIGCTAWPDGYGEPNWTARASAHRGTEGEG